MLNIGPIFNALLRNKSSVILMVLQIALTLAIVSNAAYIINERIEMMQRDTGLKEDQLFGFSVYFFDENVDIHQQYELDEDMLRAIPGVNNAVAINQIPLSGSGDSSGFRNQLEREGAINAQAGMFKGDEHMLSTLGLEVSEGRDFTAEDIVYATGGELPASVIITRAMSEVLFPETGALGKDIYVFDHPMRVIGIIDHVQGPWVHWDIVNQNIFSPIVDKRTFKRYIVNVDPNERDRVMLSIQEKMSALNKGRVVNSNTTFEEYLAESYSRDRLMVNMLVIIISVLLFITALGIAGMAIFNVNRRKRQIGTRRALGASQTNILTHFMTENFLMTAIGIAIGIVLTVFLNGFLIEHFSSSRISSSYVISTIVGLFVLGQIAVLFPAKRAANTSPAIATRSV